MHSEYRILNIVLSEYDNNYNILSDIAVFQVDEEQGINNFSGLLKQVNSNYPYTQELIVKKNTDVVILDGIQFNGNLKTLLKKNKHLVMSQTDYQYKDYVYVICQLDVDSYLVYSDKNEQEIVNVSTLKLWEEMGKLYNAVVLKSTVRGKERTVVVTGTNCNDEKKRTKAVELRGFYEGGVALGKRGQFAVDVINIKSNTAVKKIYIKSGKLVDILQVDSNYPQFDFSLPSTFTDFVSTGRKYTFEGKFNVLNISSLQLLSKNALLFKGSCNKFIISERAARSSDFDFLVYSLRMYTGDSDYKINELVITDIAKKDVLDLVIRLLAELYFNTDYNTVDRYNFPIYKITMEGPAIDYLKETGNYNRWIGQGLVKFSKVLMENYMNAVSYYKKALKLENKKTNELSIQSLSLMADYEEALLQELSFFNLAESILTDKDCVSAVYTNIANLIEQNKIERTTSVAVNKDNLIDNFLKKLS